MPAEASGGARKRAAAVVLASAVMLAACAGPRPLAPVGRAPERASTATLKRSAHTVRAGDTLYSIAWRYGLDYRALARWNAIPEPFTIRPGQRIRTTRPARLPPMPRPEAAPAKSAAQAKRAAPPARPSGRPPRAERPARAARPPAPRTTDAAVKRWRWPARGKVIGHFGKGGGNGIDIRGARGSAVTAAAPGYVVYSGSGLRGYGRLIIVKHNKRYLSAYAHNDRLHVKEGDSVKSGQRIADMGSSGAKSVRLHFEIRRDGKPVDPIRFLPR